MADFYELIQCVVAGDGKQLDCKLTPFKGEGGQAETVRSVRDLVIIGGTTHFIGLEEQIIVQPDEQGRGGNAFDCGGDPQLQVRNEGKLVCATTTLRKAKR